MFTIGVLGHVFSHPRSSLVVHSHRHNAPSLNPYTSTVATTTVNSNFLKSTIFLRSIATILTTSLFLDLEKGSDRNSGGSYGGSGGKSGGVRHGDEGEFFCSWLLCPVAIADDNQFEGWDSHGLPANVLVQVKNLRGFKRYKVSDILLLNRVGTKDLVFEKVSLHPGGVYTKSQLEKELKSLNTGMFKVDLQLKTNPDGTISVSISFLERDKDYWRRIQREILQNVQGKDSVRLLQKLHQGRVFITEAGNRSMKNRNWLAPFSKNNGGINIKTDIKKMENDSAEVGPEWSTISERYKNGRTFSMEIRNFNDLNTRILGSGTMINFLNPQDYLGVKVECVYPYIEGVENPYKRIIRTSYFNTRMKHPVLVGDLDQGPVVRLYRNGVKANITENITVNSKGTYGLILEAIKPPSRLFQNNPLLFVNDTDHMAVFRGDITADNTKLINGTIVGQSIVIQADKGFVIGDRFRYFNRYQCSLTGYIPLKGVEEGLRKSPPPILMVHGKYGICIGDCPWYDKFIIGERYSLRGYNMGVVCPTRKFLKLGAELRIPVKKTLVYAFAEHGNDLWASVDGNGDALHGSSYGFGIKWGPLRAEYARDHNSRSWHNLLTIG